MAAPAISTHGVMEGGGSYNLNARIPADAATLATNTPAKRRSRKDRPRASPHIPELGPPCTEVAA
jgi:hypothetical protein